MGRMCDLGGGLGGEERTLTYDCIYCKQLLIIKSLCMFSWLAKGEGSLTT